MRTTMNINAVVNVVGRQDRVAVIASMVSLCLQRFEQQLLWLAASFAKPSLRHGAKHSLASYWSECTGSSASGELMSGGGEGPTGLLGLRPTLAGFRTAS